MNGMMPGGSLNDEGTGTLQDEMTMLDENGNPINDETPADGDGTPGEEDGELNDQEADETQNDEGSGGDEGAFLGGFPTFAFPTFFRSFTSSFGGQNGRSAFEGRGNRQGRQLYTPCLDRITLPCIVEDFIGAGMGDVPSCIPIHCGNSLCHSSGGSACKIETSVTPFYLGVHFGDGKKNKGSPEDNIGACLRYKQLPCS